MTSPDIMADLRLADRSLRRYATHLTGRPVDAILHTAYVSAVRSREPVWDGNRASVSLFRHVHTSSAPTAVGEGDDGSGDLGAALRSIPVTDRGALLLTSVEGLSAAEAAQVLDIAVTLVPGLADSAGALVRQRVPALRSADPAALRRALGELPVRPALPSFWEQLEAEVSAHRPAPPSGPESLTVHPEPTGPPVLPPRESPWPAVGAGVGAVAVIILIIAFLVSRTGNDEIATEGTSATASTPTLPSTSEGQTAAPAPTGSLSAPAPTAPPAADATDAPSQGGGGNDRGRLPLEGGLAIINGSLSPGTADLWRVEVQSGQTLSVAASGLSGVELTVIRSDGSTLSADYADSGLVVVTEPGTHALRFSNGRRSTAAYSVGVGLTEPRSGFLTNLDEQGAAVSTLEIISCSSTQNRLDASLMTSAGAQVVVAFSQGTGADTVNWSGSDAARGEISSTSSVPTGFVFAGPITAGREALVGLPFWLGVYGCESGS